MWNNTNKKAQSYPNNSFVPSGRSFEEGEVFSGARGVNRAAISKEEGELVTPTPAPSFSSRITSNTSLANDVKSTNYNSADSNISDINVNYGYAHGGHYSQRQSFSSSRPRGGHNYHNNSSHSGIYSTSPLKSSPPKFGSYASLSDAGMASNVGDGTIGVLNPHPLPHWEPRKRSSFGSGGSNRGGFDHRRPMNSRPWESPRGSPPGRGRFGRFDHSYNKQNPRSQMTWDRRSSIGGAAEESTPGRNYYGPNKSSHNEKPAHSAEEIIPDGMDGSSEIPSRIHYEGLDVPRNVSQEYSSLQGEGPALMEKAQSGYGKVAEEGLMDNCRDDKRLIQRSPYDKMFKNAEIPHYESTQKPLNDLQNNKGDPLRNEAVAVNEILSVKPLDMNDDKTDIGSSEMSSEVTSNHAPHRIKCSALGSEKAEKALNLIQNFPDIFSEDLFKCNMATIENIYLPSSDQTHNVMLEIESKIDSKNKEISELKALLKKTIKLEMFIKEEAKRKEDEKQLQLVKQQEIIEKNIEDEEYTKCLETIKIDEMRSNLDELNKSLSDLNGEIHEKNWLIHDETKLKQKRLDDDYETLISTTQDSTKEAEDNLSRSLRIVNELRNRMKLTKERGLQGFESCNLNDYKEDIISSAVSVPVAQNLKVFFDELKDDPSDMNDLISTVMNQNRINAQQSHVSVLSSLLSGHPDRISLAPPLLSEDPTDDDIKTYNEYWSTKAAGVSGLGDALYVEPSTAPLYEKIKTENKDLHLLVREYLRDSNIRLFQNWSELAEEYAVRQQIYTQDCGHELKDIHSADMFGGSFSILGQRRGAGGAEVSPQPATNAQDSTKSRGTNNPYRRARRSATGFDSGIGGSDIVRSDYEQEQIIAQLTAQAVMEKRIKEGRSDLPRQVGPLERKYSATFIDYMSHRRMYDPVQDEQEQRLVNPWTDIEKCIFFDRFLQHPKDFRKIASFLKNKTTHDCISFYYDSKQTVPYKTALKEHLIRKKRRGEGVSWEATIQSALSLGATVTKGYDIERPLIFHLPEDDNSFHTKLFHPLDTELFDPTLHEVTYNSIRTEARKRKTSSIENLFVLQSSQRKLLKLLDSGVVGKKSSQNDSESMSNELISRPTSDTSLFENVNEPKRGPGRRRGAAAKWTEEEKESFFKALDKNGRKWEMIAESVETKTPSQVRNFYYDNKKYFDRMKMSKNNSEGQLLHEQSQGLQGLERFNELGMYGQNPTSIHHTVQNVSTWPGDRYMNLPTENPISIAPQSWDQIAFFMEQQRQLEHHLILNGPNTDNQRQLLSRQAQTPPWILHQIYGQRSDVIRDMIESSSINNYVSYNQFQQDQVFHGGLNIRHEHQDYFDRSTNQKR